MKKSCIFLFLILCLQSICAQKPEIESKVIELFNIQFNSPDKAIAIGKEILNSPESDKVQTSYALIGIGSCYGIKGMPHEAIMYLLKAVEEVKYTGNYELKTNANMALANAYIKMKLVAQADKYTKEAIEYAKKEPNLILKNGTLSRVYQFIGENYKNKKEYQPAIANLKKAQYYAELYENIRPSKHTPARFDILYLSFGETYYDAQKIDSAEWAFNKSLNNTNDIHNKIFSYLYLGKIYTHKGENKRAVDTLSIALKANNNERLYLQTELYGALLNSYRSLNDLENYEKYNDLFLASSQKLSQEEKEALEESIKQEQIMSEAQNKDKNQKIISLIAILIVLILAGSYGIYKFRQNKKKERLLFQNIISKLEDKLKEGNSNTITPESSVSETSQESFIELSKAQKENTIPKVAEEEILQKLNRFEQSEKFTNSKLSLSLLASQFNTNTNYLSEVINTHKKKNYNAYINELRINYICNKIITEPEYRNYKISYLAEVCGFSSYAVFTTVFKNITQMSPSSFIKQAGHLT